MKFTAIELQDIFAYYGPSRIDLSECTEGKNIVLVQGANGAGKTSLLNAIKLLFVGAQDDKQRRVMQGQPAINPKAYVMGAPGRWYGVFNRHARAEGRPASIALTWEDRGVVHRAERLFALTPGGSDYRETLSVLRDGLPLKDTEAKAFIRTLLPHEVVPFFFFDGEQIQSLADARFGKEQAEIERLLGLSFIGQLLTEISAFEKARKSANLEGDVRAEIVDLQGKADAADARAEAARLARTEIETERMELDREKALADAERDSLRGGLSDAERKRMESRITMVALQREQIAADVAAKLPPEAPMLANLPLARQAFELLDAAISGSADRTLSGRLHTELPEQLIAGLGLLQPQVTLSDRQQTDFRRHVGAALETNGVSSRPVSSPVLQALSPRRMKELRDQFFLWRAHGADTASRHADQLRTLRNLLHEERGLRRELHEAEITSEEARARFAVLTEVIDGLDVAINETVARATARGIEETAAVKDAAEYRTAINDKYAEHADLVANNKIYQFAKSAKTALEAYKDERRKQIRSSVEDRLRDHVEVLLARSQLVRDVRLSDQFSISYLDSEGEQVARHSLSAGMRQMAAMAMLWSLKDEADRPMPVVIDTPLGRIDAENRGLLVDEYFPHAGNPLILLPTNSEITVEDYDTLIDHVARRYVIDNEGGTRASIRSVEAG